MKGIARWFAIERVVVHQRIASELDAEVYPPFPLEMSCLHTLTVKSQDTVISNNMFAFLLDKFDSEAAKVPVPLQVFLEPDLTPAIIDLLLSPSLPD